VEKQDGDETAAGINRKIREGKETDASSGVYYLRTSRMGLSEETVWEYYNIICNVEDTFRTLKPDLNLRPIDHRKDDSTQANIFFGLLSCRIVNTIRVQLMRKGIRHDSTEPTRIMMTQKAVIACAVNKPGEKVKIRTRTVPKEKLQGLYYALIYKS
jgi:transposase